MATKLKNSRKFGIGLIFVILLAAAGVMVGFYPLLMRNVLGDAQAEFQAGDYLELTSELLKGNIFQYNEICEESDISAMMEIYSDKEYFLLKKYMDYEMFNADGEAQSKRNTESTVKKLQQENTEYAYRVRFDTDGEGNLKHIKVTANSLSEEECYDIESNMYNYDSSDWDIKDTVAYPVNSTFIYGFTEDNLERYIESTDTLWYEKIEALRENQIYLALEMGLMALVAAAAFLISRNPNWRLDQYKLFHAPLEIVLLAFVLIYGNGWSRAERVLTLLSYRAVTGYAQYSGNEFYLAHLQGTSASEMNISMIKDYLLWVLLFAVVYWGVTCLLPMITMKGAYWKERTLICRIYAGAKQSAEEKKQRKAEGKLEKQEENKRFRARIVNFCRNTVRKIKNYFSRIYDGLTHMDLRDKTNRTIVQIVLLNFIVLLLICCFWFYGVFALLVYSVVLYLFLRKYFRDIQKHYEQLLQATNLLAEGKLDAPIGGDMGIFNPVRTELQKIQTGFQKAVKEEVKSERMKTELITNVSHDLKTPLTAIITYVDLLKHETDPVKQKEYLDILERKSLRLKVLIEDLFEISKATSKNVTMNFMDVDIAGLLKQVALECDKKIRDANLEFRWNMPEGKVILLLDSQKTYRIFENLVVNITKYAMPHTRVYIELQDLEKEVVIRMKNISAAELNFDTEEITDRFVRGDASRNTEGSGLGLAIAKSFTELQYGTLKITTDADLFKVEIRFPKRTETPEPAEIPQG